MRLVLSSIALWLLLPLASHASATRLIVSSPPPVYLLIDNTVKMYERCDPVHFGSLDYSKKRETVVQLFVRHGLIDGSRLETDWPSMKQNVTKQDVSMFREQFDWATKLGQEVKQAIRNYMKDKRHQMCGELVAMLQRTTVKPTDSWLIYKYMRRPLEVKLALFEARQFGNDYFLQFKRRITRHQSTRAFVTFWFEAFLAVLSAQGRLEKFKPYIRSGALKEYLLNLDLWPDDLPPDYFEATYRRARKDAEHWRQLGEAFEHVEMDSILRLVIQQLEPKDKDHLFVREVKRILEIPQAEARQIVTLIKGRLYMMALEKLFQMSRHDEAQTGTNSAGQLNSAVTSSEIKDDESTSSMWLFLLLLLGACLLAIAVAIYFLKRQSVASREGHSEKRDNNNDNQSSTSP